MASFKFAFKAAGRARDMIRNSVVKPVSNHIKDIKAEFRGMKKEPKSFE